MRTTKLMVAAAAVMLAASMAAVAQVHDNGAGGGAYINMTAGTVNCNLSGAGGCTIVPNTTIGITGTTTNDSANAGSIGEFKTVTVASGSAVSETTATPVDVALLALTPGDWDCSAVIDRTLAGTTATIYGGGISLTLNTLPTQPGGSGLGTDALVTQIATWGTTLTGVGSTVIPPVRVLIAANTTIHLVAGDTFSAGTVAVFGTMRCRRVR